MTLIARERISIQRQMTKIMKILIAYDGSECSDSALDDLLYAGLPINAEAQVIAVAGYERLSSNSSPEVKASSQAFHHGGEIAEQ
jgi:hypothetical protein